MVSGQEVTHGPKSLASEDRLEATIAAELPPSEPPPIPARISRYRVDECIGSGAMGLVLRAHDPQLDRVVAIKLLRSQATPGASLGTTRLLREARALARLSHPNVIDVFDVGTMQGRVFIAMEYVAGQTLDAWQRDERPSPDALIDAYLQAGRGLAAAHEAGLVHRDFKPANVLRGEDGRVRVVDFGLAAPPRDHEARATLGSRDDDVMDVRMTATGFVVGTPAYMAPEAHCGDLVDAKSDQFSFCVALFEALWGARPFLGKTPKEVASEAIGGKIHFPPGVDVPSSLREVVLRGLSPSPADRWPSMDVLLDRLQPRRRPYWPWVAIGGVAVVAVVAMLLVPGASTSAGCEQQAGAVAQIWGEPVQARVHEAFTRSELSYAEETWPRVREHLDAHTAELAEARRLACEASITASAPVEQIDRRMACLERQQADLQGVVTVLEQADATVVRNAVRILGGLGSIEACSDEVLTATIPPPPPAIARDVERAHRDMAQVKAKLRAGQYGSAAVLAREVIERIQPLDYPPLQAEARYLLARVLEDDGQYEAAQQEMSEALLVAQGAGHDELVAEASTELIYLLGSKLRRPDEAERWLRHARAAIGRLSSASKAKTFLESTLGNFHWTRGELDVARDHFERALGAREQQLGTRHPMTLIVRSNLAMVHHDLGENTKARALIERTLADRIEVYGPSHPEVAANYGNLAVIEQRMGELDDAAMHTRRALEILESSVGREHPHYPQMLVNLSNTEYFRGNLDEALRLQEQARDLLIDTLGPRDFLVGRTLSNLGAFYLEAERYDDARVALLEARRILEEHLRSGHPELAGTIGNLASVDRRTGRLDEALAGYSEAIAMIEQTLGREHVDLASSLLGRGATYLELDRAPEGLADLRRAVALVAQAEVDPERVAQARYELGLGLWTTGEHAEAIDQMKQARALVDRAPREPDDLPAEIDTWLAEHPTAGD